MSTPDPKVTERIVIYLHRRDVRLSDNPVYHRLARDCEDHRADTPQSRHVDSHQRGDEEQGSDDEERPNKRRPAESDDTHFTHILPIYIFPAQQVDVSGFLSQNATENPYQGWARSKVAKIYRTGVHRVSFVADGVWDLKTKLDVRGSGLEVRVGTFEDVVKHILDWYSQRPRFKIAGIWMTHEEGDEEKQDESAVRRLATHHGIEMKVWHDEKYYIDDRDLPFGEIQNLPEAYTAYRKSLEPLRDQPRRALGTPTSLPPLPSEIPPQSGPFKIPATLEGLTHAVQKPFERDSTYGLSTLVIPQEPKGMELINGHPFRGGETDAQARLSYLIRSGSMTAYNSTRNGMIGTAYSTKLSAYLSQGHLTARQIHWALLDFENGEGEGQGAPGYGEGETPGTWGVRFELLWRDYMRLLQRKYRNRMFNIYGRLDEAKAAEIHWRYIDDEQGPNPKGDPAKNREDFERFCAGRTGMGLIDASQREILFTGYTSNRARQNVASYLAKHLEIDWRVGAEWYECLLTDYDVCNNWGNWQYVAGVGNDPRQNRVFNPIKQAFDYDRSGEFIQAWIPELQNVHLRKTVKDDGTEEIEGESVIGLYQAYRLPEGEKINLGLKGVDWVDRPLHIIPFSVHKKTPGQPGRNTQLSWRTNGPKERNFRRMGQEDRRMRYED